MEGKFFLILSQSGHPVLNSAAPIRGEGGDPLVQLMHQLYSIRNVFWAGQMNCVFDSLKTERTSIVVNEYDSLTFVCVSTRGEPEIVLKGQLYFVYRLVLLLLGPRHIKVESDVLSIFKNCEHTMRNHLKSLVYLMDSRESFFLQCVEKFPLQGPVISEVQAVLEKILASDEVGVLTEKSYVMLLRFVFNANISGMKKAVCASERKLRFSPLDIQLLTVLTIPLLTPQSLNPYSMVASTSSIKTSYETVQNMSALDVARVIENDVSSFTTLGLQVGGSELRKVMVFQKALLLVSHNKGVVIDGVLKNTEIELMCSLTVPCESSRMSWDVEEVELLVELLGDSPTSSPGRYKTAQQSANPSIVERFFTPNSGSFAPHHSSIPRSPIRSSWTLPTSPIGSLENHKKSLLSDALGQGLDSPSETGISSTGPAASLSSPPFSLPPAPRNAVQGLEGIWNESWTEQSVCAFLHFSEPNGSTVCRSCMVSFNRIYTSIVFVVITPFGGETFAGGKSSVRGSRTVKIGDLREPTSEHLDIHFKETKQSAIIVADRLKDYLSFFSTRQENHITLRNLGVDKYPGLVHFVFIDRKRHEGIVPKFDPLTPIHPSMRSSDTSDVDSVDRIRGHLYSLFYHSKSMCAASDASFLILQNGAYQYVYRLFTTYDASTSRKRMNQREFSSAGIVLHPVLTSVDGARVTNVEPSGEQAPAGSLPYYDAISSTLAVDKSRALCEFYGIFVAFVPLEMIELMTRRIVQQMFTDYL